MAHEDRTVMPYGPATSSSVMVTDQEDPDGVWLSQSVCKLDDVLRQIQCTERDARVMYGHDSSSPYAIQAHELLQKLHVGRAWVSLH